MQAQPAAVRLVGERVPYLMEFLENDLLIFRADAPTVVAHIDPKAAFAFSQRNLDPAIRSVAVAGNALAMPICSVPPTPTVVGPV